MDSRSGKAIRLSRLFDPASSRSLIVAYSHGSFIGPMSGMESLTDLRRVAAEMSAAEGILVSPGLVTPLEALFAGRAAPSLVVHLDWMNFTREILPPERIAVAPLATIADALAAGADAVMTFLYYGDPELEAAQVRQVAELARECDRLGMPLIVEPRSGREHERIADESDLEIILAFSRMCAEIGADIVKVVWRGGVERIPELARVVDATPAAVFLAGGSLVPDFRDVLMATEYAREAGLTGLIYGRNLFQTVAPGAAVAAVRAVFHDGKPIDGTMAVHPELAAVKGAAKPSRY